MDYFSELLESYNKLKKRTFKLTYITEAEDKPDNKGSSQEDIDSASIQDAEAQAKDVALAGVQQQYDDSKRVKGGVPWAYLSPAKGTEAARVSLTLGAGRPMSLADAVGNPIVDSQGWKRLVSYFQGAGPGARDAELAEEERLEIEKQERRTVGGFLSQQGIDAIDTTIQLEKVKSNIDDYCSQHKDTQAVDSSLKRLCSAAWTYVAAGESHMGLEYKIATTKTTTVVDPETGKTEQNDASPVLMNQAARSAAFLTSFLANANPLKCKLVKSRIGMFKGKELVLFGDNPTEGIVVGEPNAVQKLALKQIEDACGITQEDLTQLVGDGINDKQKNAIKGTFFEAVLVFAGNAGAARGIQDPKKREEALEASMADLKKVLIKQKDVLKAILGGMDPEAGQSIDDAFAKGVQAKALDLLTGDPAKMKDWILNEIRAVYPFMQFMKADSIVHGGLTSKTGQRADLMFAYKKESAAEEKAKAIGSSVTPLDDGTFGVGVGLKRLQTMGSAKFGEINSMQRMVDLITGELTEDKNIEPGFQKSIQTRLFKKPGTERESALKTYAENLETNLRSRTDLLVNDLTFVTPEGKIKSQTSDATLQLLANQLPSKIDLLAGRPGPLATAFFNFDGDAPTQKNFSGDSPLSVENRARAREQVMRVARFRQLKTDMEDPTKRDAAMDYMLKSALICGSNKQDMNQLIVDDKGETLAVRHNKVFDTIGKARNNPDPENQPTFTFKESGVTICAPNGICMSYNQEGTSAKDNGRETRSLVKIPRKTLTATAVKTPDSPKAENSSTLMQYLSGQMRLLETLISQSK